MVRYSLEERIFIFESYIKTKNVKKCKRKFKKEFPLGKVPSKSTILQLIKRVREKGSVWKSNESHRLQKITLTEEKVDEIGAQLEQCPEKSLEQLAQETNISPSSVWRATKLLLRTASEFEDKLQKVKCEADQNESDSTEQMCNIHDAKTTVKIEKMDQEEEGQPQELEEYSLNEDLFTLKQEYDMKNVKEEPHLEDEDVSNDYVPASLNAEEIYVKKEKFEEEYDSEAGNTTSL